MFRHIIAATDLSESSVAAMRYARMLAERFRARLTIIYSDPIDEHQQKLRDEVETHVAPVLAGLPYDIEVTTGPPADMIVRTQRAKNEDLIVMGTHGHRGWRRAVLGSVAENVLHTAHCPVLTVSRHSGLPVQGPVAIARILCPTNFSEVAHESLTIANELADAFGAQLEVVHVVEGDAPPPPENANYRQIVLRGGAAERILDYAEDMGADLLVIGAQRQMFRDATVIGTTTERLVRFASCPVLAVTRQAAERKPVEEQELVGASR